MQKIPTLFVRDETRRGHPVMNQVRPECQWVLDGEGIATKKIDGTNVKVEGGFLSKRQKPSDSGLRCRRAYVMCDRCDPADRWAFEAYDAGPAVPSDGIYELVGPKVQGNPQHYSTHTLVRVVPPADELIVCMNELRSVYGLTFDGLLRWLDAHTVEGLVFHHPDGRMAKIKRRDFGLVWPVRRED